MATIKDVAKLAGVSVTTVSRCFNNRGYIGEATRKKIDEACKELNYQPNELARSLFTKKSMVIGVLVPYIDSEFFAKLVQRIESELYSRGYKMMLCCTNGDEEKEKSYFDLFKAQRVDGVIVGSYLLEQSFNYEQVGIPMVGFDRYLKGGIPCVGSDHYEMGRLATEALLEKGCTRLVHIMGDSKITGPPHEKTVAFREICESRNIPYYVLERDIQRSQDEEFSRLLQCIENDFPDYDGLFLSDSDAGYYLQYAHKKGIRIPEDVQIMGYDNIPLCQLTYPTISTVAQSYTNISEHLVDILQKAIDVKGAYEKLEPIERLPVRLIERGSTRKPLLQ